MGLTPPLQKLIFALAVVRELHFGRAARRLNISQPYLSRTIREYEGELGFSLFRRNRRVVEVTAAGRAFLKHAGDILADLDNAYDRAVEAGRLLSRHNASSLVIGCSAFVPPRLRSQTRSIQKLRFPALHLELRVASPAETFESIRSGAFQAGVTYAPLDRDDLAQIPLGSERLHAVFPRARSANGTGEIALTDLRTRPLIVPCSERTHPALRRWLLEQCEKAGFRPNIVEELSSADGVFDLVQDGVGVAILPGEACDGMPPDLECVPISNLEPAELVLAYRREAPLQVQKVVAEIAHSLRHFEHKRKFFSRTSRSAKRPIVSIGSRRPRSNNWGGASTSRLQTNVLLSTAIRNFTLPAGLTFQSKHFGATGQHQFGVALGQESGGDQSRISLHSGWGPFSFTGYAEQDTNVPSLSFILKQVAGLQQELNQLGIRATSVQQVDELLSNNSFLIAAGYVKGATINLVSARSQFGGTAGWSSQGVHARQMSYSTLFNDNHLLQGSTQDVGHTLSYSQKITHSDDITLTSSVFTVKSSGTSWEYTPIFFLSWRHQFQHVPRFIVPERRGTITGNVFRDDESKGVWERGMKPIPEVKVELDGRRHTITSADGSYRFPGVPRGTHRIAVIYRSRDPFFFTTASDVEVDEDSSVNFGIGHSLSGLLGQVLNDAGQGVGGITVVIRNRESNWSVTTEANGSFFVARLEAGNYDVQLDEDSLPMGYSAEGLVERQQVAVGASSPGKATFTVPALRSISGRVLRHEPKLGEYVPVIGAQLTVRGLSITSETDLTGRYQFRNLAAGSYTISVQDAGQTSSHTLHLGTEPVGLTNVDFQTGGSHPPDLLAPGEPPAKP